MAMNAELVLRITGNGGVTVSFTRTEAIVLRDFLIREFPPIRDPPKKGKP